MTTVSAAEARRLALVAREHEIGRAMLGDENRLELDDGESIHEVR